MMETCSRRGWLRLLGCAEPARAAAHPGGACNPDAVCLELGVLRGLGADLGAVKRGAAGQSDGVVVRRVFRFADGRDGGDERVARAHGCARGRSGRAGVAWNGMTGAWRRAEGAGGGSQWIPHALPRGRGAQGRGSEANARPRRMRVPAGAAHFAPRAPERRSRLAAAPPRGRV